APRIGQPVSGMLPKRHEQRSGIALIAIDDVYIDVAAVFNEFLNHRTEHNLTPAWARGLADDHFGDIAGASISEQFLAYILAAERDGLSAQLIGETEGLYDTVAIRCR